MVTLSTEVLVIGGGATGAGVASARSNKGSKKPSILDPTDATEYFRSFTLFFTVPFLAGRGRLRQILRTHRLVEEHLLRDTYQVAGQIV